MKKLISMLLALALVCCLLPTAAFASEIVASGTCGDNLTWTLDGDGVLTISGNGPMPDFIMDVAPWNLYGGQLTHVAIEPGVTSIGANAFEMCGMTSVEIPDTVTSIGKEAFHLSGLQSAVIPESVTQFGDGIFSHSDLAEITLPENMTGIPDRMCHGCSYLTSIDIPDGVTSIGEYAFFGAQLSEVTIPAGVTSIGDLGFGNYSLESAQLTFLGDAPAIADGALGFRNVTVYYPAGNSTWDELVTGYVPDRGDSISWVAKSDGAFGENETERDDTISGTCGDNLTWTLDSNGTLTISGTGELSYYHREWKSYKDSIKALVIEEGVSGEVGYFESYENLISVSLPGTVTAIVQNAFSGCTALETVAFSEGLKSIGSNAFYGCTGLTEIMIPASVTQLGARPFAYCSNLTGIWVDENSETYINDENGVLFTMDMTTLVEAPCTLKGDYVIPETVGGINWAAFSGCKGLTSVVIPDGVICIDSVLFADCTALTSVEIPDSVEWIANAAFENCSSLKEITIPASVTSIDPGIFDGCTALEKIVFEGDAPHNGDYYTFDGLTTTAYYPEGNATWTEDAMLNYGGNITWVAYDPDPAASGSCGDNLTWTLDGDGVLTVSGTGPMWDFVYETAGWNLYGAYLSHVVIEPGVTSIGAKAFAMCSMTSIDIPDTVTSIGTDAFAFSDLQSVVIPESVTEFGEKIFENSMLSEVTLPGNMTEIPAEMFHFCGELTSIEIPESVTSIGDFAFFSAGIDRVTIPASVTSVGYLSFGNYWMFESAELTFLGDAPAIVDGAFGFQNVTIYYPAGNSTWDEVVSGYVPGEGTLINWVPYGAELPEAPGDMDGDGIVDDSDVAQLLWYTLFPEQYEIAGNADFNGDGKVDDTDVAYLLWHTLFPDAYPIG